MSLTETKTTVLLIVALVATLISHGFMTANFLDKEAEAAAKNAQLCEQADRIEALESEAAALQEILDMVDLKCEIYRQTPEETEAAATALIQETMAEREAAYARLYK